MLDRTEHLDEIFELLRQAAAKDLRVGQIINCAMEFRKPWTCEMEHELFFIENEDLLAALKAAINRTEAEDV